MEKAAGEPQNRFGRPKEGQVGRRLIVAFVLIGVAIGGLMMADQLRHRPAVLAPPHEPSQTLITVPALESDSNATPATQTTDTSYRAQSGTDAHPMAPGSLEPAVARSAIESGVNTGPTRAARQAYLVQLGIFNSPANALALQKQLRLAGVEARLETRVQLGPFHDKREAQKALARAKKLGIDAVLVGTR